MSVDNKYLHVNYGSASVTGHAAEQKPALRATTAQAYFDLVTTDDGYDLWLALRVVLREYGFNVD